MYRFGLGWSNPDPTGPDLSAAQTVRNFCLIFNIVVSNITFLLKEKRVRTNMWTIGSLCVFIQLYIYTINYFKIELEISFICRNKIKIMIYKGYKLGPFFAELPCAPNMVGPLGYQNLRPLFIELLHFFYH